MDGKAFAPNQALEQYKANRAALKKAKDAKDPQKAKAKRTPAKTGNSRQMTKEEAMEYDRITRGAKQLTIENLEKKAKAS